MKPIFCIDITKNKNNQTLNGDELVTAKVSRLQAEQLEKAVDRVIDQEKKTKMPGWLNVVRLVLMGAFIFCFSLFASGLMGGETFAKVYAETAVFLWTGVGSLVLWLTIAFLSGKKEKEVLTSDETQRVVATAEQLLENVYDELHVPRNAASMDILVFRYVLKNGQVVPKATGIVTFMSCVCKVFTENGMLCIADADQRYEIPLGAVRRIVTVNKDASIPTWNKDVPTNKPPYKQYKLRLDDYGFIHFKPYYILELEHEGQAWSVYFPSYELPLVEALTGHHPE